MVQGPQFYLLYLGFTQRSTVQYTYDKIFDNLYIGLKV